jgi:hypothetical protein
MFASISGGRRAARRGVHRAPRNLEPGVCDLESRLLFSADMFAPTDAEQYMLELINRARGNPTAEADRLLLIAQSDPLIKATTQNWNLSTFYSVISSIGPQPPLAFNPNLIEAARDHDSVMLAANAQVHSPTGYLTDPSVAQEQSGQAFYPTGNGAWSTGENIYAYSQGVNPAAPQSYADFFHESFLLDWGNPDFGHLRNVLAPGPNEAVLSGSYPFNEVGIGLLSGVSPSVARSASIPGTSGLKVGPDLVTEEFGWRSGIQFLTGVIYQDRAGTGFYAPTGEGLGGVTINAVDREGEGSFQTQTWASGGYSLELPPGTYNVSATGNLPQAYSTLVTVSADNVGWDIRLPAQPGSASPSGLAGAATTAVAPPPSGVSSGNPGQTGHQHASSTPFVHVRRSPQHHIAIRHAKHYRRHA